MGAALMHDAAMSSIDVRLAVHEAQYKYSSVIVSYVVSAVINTYCKTFLELKKSAVSVN
jgi:hypothetical protein